MARLVADIWHIMVTNPAEGSIQGVELNLRLENDHVVAAPEQLDFLLCKTGDYVAGFCAARKWRIVTRSLWYPPVVEEFECIGDAYHYWTVDKEGEQPPLDAPCRCGRRRWKSVTESVVVRARF